MQIDWGPFSEGYEDPLVRYDRFVNKPRIMIDNGVCADATRITLHSWRKDVRLIDPVQMFTDLNQLSIKKAYLLSEGGWFKEDTPTLHNLGVEYAWKPLHCSHCKSYGHSVEKCLALKIATEKVQNAKAAGTIAINASAGHYDPNNDGGSFTMVGKNGKPVKNPNGHVIGSQNVPFFAGGTVSYDKNVGTGAVWGSNKDRNNVPFFAGGNVSYAHGAGTSNHFGNPNGGSGRNNGNNQNIYNGGWNKQNNGGNKNQNGNGQNQNNLHNGAKGKSGNVSNYHNQHNGAKGNYGNSQKQHKGTRGILGNLNNANERIPSNWNNNKGKDVLNMSRGQHIPVTNQNRFSVLCGEDGDFIISTSTVIEVTDLDGNKLTDESVINCIQQPLENIFRIRSNSTDGVTALELTCTDRVGLLSDVSTVLSDLNCDIFTSKVWTHNGLFAALFYFKDCDSGLPIRDSQRINRIKAGLGNILQGNNYIRIVKTSGSISATGIERRLHQMMFADRDYDKSPIINTNGQHSPLVSIQNCSDKKYSTVNIQVKDQPKLLFDVICTLTDMQYKVVYATNNTKEDEAYLELFITQRDGSPITSKWKKQRVITCLRAALERRKPTGLRLELSKEDKPGLLAEVMQTFKENGINVTQSEISTTMGMALNIFYVTDGIRNPVDSKVIDSVRQIIGLSFLRVNEVPNPVLEIEKRKQD